MPSRPYGCLDLRSRNPLEEGGHFLLSSNPLAGILILVFDNVQNLVKGNLSFVTVDNLIGGGGAHEARVHVLSVKVLHLCSLEILYA